MLDDAEPLFHLEVHCAFVENRLPPFEIVICGYLFPNDDSWALVDQGLASARCAPAISRRHGFGIATKPCLHAAECADCSWCRRFRVTSYGCPSQLAEACAFLRVDICRTRTVALCAQRSDGQDMLSLQFRMLSFSCVRCAAGAAAGDGFAVAASLAWACPRLRLASFPYSRSWDLLDQGLIKVRCAQGCVVARCNMKKSAVQVL